MHFGQSLSEAHDYRIALRPSDPPGTSILRNNYIQTGFGPQRIWRDQTYEIDALVANVYEIVVERRDELPSSITRWTPVSKPAKVRVIAGAQALMRLEGKN